MALPTFSSITPSTGHPGGRELVRISGTNFRLPTVLPHTLPTVRVRFAGEAALRVDAVASTLLEVLVPQYRGAVTQQSGGSNAVAVEITNLDDAGVAIPGETLTVASAYTYTRPDPRAPAGDLAPREALNELIRLLRRQVLANAFVRTDTDYGATGAATKLFATLPVLWLSDLRMPLEPGARRRPNESLIQQVDAVFREEFWPSVTLKLMTTLNGASDKLGECWNLAHAALDAIQRTPYLLVDDPTLGRLQFPLEYEQEALSFGTVPTDNNISTFTLPLVVRDLEVRLTAPIRRITDADAVAFDVGRLLANGTVPQVEQVPIDD